MWSSFLHSLPKPASLQGHATTKSTELHIFSSFTKPVVARHGHDQLDRLFAEPVRLGAPRALFPPPDELEGIAVPPVVVKRLSDRRGGHRFRHFRRDLMFDAVAGEGELCRPIGRLMWEGTGPRLSLKSSRP